MPRFWPIPTIPANVCQVWHRFGTAVPAAFMLAYDVAGALTSPPFSAGHFIADYNAWIFTAFQHTICTGDGFRDMWTFYNDGAKTFSFPGLITTGLVQAPGTYDSPMLCPVFRKESVGYSPTRVGHMFGPRMPQPYWNNGWTAAGVAAYDILRHQLEVGFASQGLVFFPTIYSPKDFATYRIGHVSLVRRPATRYSRRDRGGFVRPYPTFPIVT